MAEVSLYMDAIVIAGLFGDDTLSLVKSAVNKRMAVRHVNSGF